MGDIEDHMHAEFFGASVEYFRKNFAYPVQDDLPVRKAHVHCAAHCLEVRLSFRRIKRSAGKLPVKDLDPVLRFHDRQEQFEIIGGDLMPESPGTAVEHDHDLVRKESPFCGKLFIEDVLRLHSLYL